MTAAFARRARIERTTQTLDGQEVDWWNTYAPLIERIWGLPDPICAAARRDYIEDVGKIFHTLLGARPLRILEIACGSGWPGRLLASPTLAVTGMDFSEGQLKIAQTKAAAAGQTNCNYVQMDINQMNSSFESSQFDGAFIHCGIHHLCTDELTGFADGLSRAPKGFPLILVEPVYLDQARWWGRALNKGLRGLYWLILHAFLVGARQDETVTKPTEKLIGLANAQGWFLSPKEVPFDREEIRRIFSQYFEIKEIEPVTLFGLSAAQYLATLSDQAGASRAAKVLLPIFNGLDRALNKLGLLPKLTSEYLFSRIVLVRK